MSKEAQDILLVHVPNCPPEIISGCQKFNIHAVTSLLRLGRENSLPDLAAALAVSQLLLEQELDRLDQLYPECARIAAVPTTCSPKMGYRLDNEVFSNLED